MADGGAWVAGAQRALSAVLARTLEAEQSLLDAGAIEPPGRILVAARE